MGDIAFREFATRDGPAEAASYRSTLPLTGRHHLTTECVNTLTFLRILHDRTGLQELFGLLRLAE